MVIVAQPMPTRYTFGGVTTPSAPPDRYASCDCRWCSCAERETGSGRLPASFGVPADHALNAFVRIARASGRWIPTERAVAYSELRDAVIDHLDALEPDGVA